MIRILITTLLLSLSCRIYAAQTLPQDVQLLVFTTQHYSITGMQSYPVTMLYHIDAVDNLEQSTVFQLNTDPKQAEQQAHALIRSPEFKQYEEQLKQAYRGLSQAFYLGVKKVPAIVFYRNSGVGDVIYGITDIEQAIALFLQGKPQ
ncbi:TPA: TIGR03757 family integrating conjugative element protein [Pasteurella multocida]|uniref:TIGR03757 family integrating conjugative element protein n=1 Tax=Pasteurella multocida TaxID=747 RepID=UPI00202065C2|nr:TIGR03757 family integrating conjugative element protein [Pasteurella multocida]HDR1435576.1 TIGR03757 family integrating conjugative element protein [Pasteurella multocida]HDR1793434.1 TIGR03757 family integrating conjugative element protein [Pasteurella multocida]HDR1868189.1 TIGR03757 family integrating conjugative element protein [Pasteurella multocida]HED4416816.1 TIGR03757 family integrating conjugative element protein [Pasteurella multocida]